jgi:hypothetical protein
MFCNSARLTFCFAFPPPGDPQLVIFTRAMGDSALPGALLAPMLMPACSLHHLQGQQAVFLEVESMVSLFAWARDMEGFCPFLSFYFCSPHARDCIQLVAVAVSVYMINILIFGAIYLLLSDQCGLGLNNYTESFLFSLETVMTIGYGALRFSPPKHTTKFVPYGQVLRDQAGRGSMAATRAPLWW